MGCSRRLITNSVHTKLVMDILCRLNAAHILLTTTTHKEQFNVLGKAIRLLHLVNAPRATTERTYISKFLRVSKCNLTSLHTTHRKACISTMLRISNHAIILLDHRDNIIEQHVLKAL